LLRIEACFTVRCWPKAAVRHQFDMVAVMTPAMLIAL
jgi:hypothetical protein